MKHRAIQPEAAAADNARQSGPPLLFEDLSAREIATVTAAATRQVLYRGARLFTQGTPQDGVYLIETGSIRVFCTAPSAQEITLAYWPAGTFVGGPEVLNPTIHMWSAVAVSDGIVLHLPSATLRDLATRMPALALAIVAGLSFSGRCYTMLTQMLVIPSAPQRLASLLLHLAELYGTDKIGGGLLVPPLTKADLALMTGTTHRSVSIALRRFVKLGIIGALGKGLVIRKMDLLKKILDGRVDSDS
jgi:CRP/FNR family transcriptional regulator, cyclic AMP receptor protein